MNILFEKFYVLLWCWFVCCLILTVFNTALWCYRMLLPYSRVEFIRKYLNLAGRKGREGREGTVGIFGREGKEERSMYRAAMERPLFEKFVHSHLGLDGVLVLRLMATNAGVVFTLAVIRNLWVDYKMHYEAAAAASITPERKSLDSESLKRPTCTLDELPQKYV